MRTISGISYINACDYPEGSSPHVSILQISTELIGSLQYKKEWDGWRFLVKFESHVRRQGSNKLRETEKNFKRYPEPVFPSKLSITVVGSLLFILLCKLKSNQQIPLWRKGTARTVASVFAGFTNYNRNAL